MDNQPTAQAEEVFAAFAAAAGIGDVEAEAADRVDCLPRRLDALDAPDGT